MVFLQALGSIVSLLLVVVLGYALSKMGWFGPETRNMLPKLVTNIALPPYLGCTIVSSFQHDDLANMFYGAAAPLACLILLFGLAWIVGKLTNVQGRHFGLFCCCVSNPNTIFIGIPVNTALFGPEALPYVLLFYFASTSFFWTIGNYFIAADQKAVGGGTTDSAFRWQKLVSPPIIGFLIGLFCVVCNLMPPRFLFQAAHITGEMTTPLALIFIGIVLADLNFAKVRLSRDLVMALTGRLVVSPLVMLAVALFIQLPPLMAKVFIMQAALPAILQISILSAYYDTDPDFGSIMVSLSTALCAFTIPVYMGLLSYLPL